MVDLTFEIINFASQVADDVCVFGYMVVHGFLISFGFALDVFGSVSVFEGVDGFLEADLPRTDVGKHHGSAVPSQGIFQHTS